MDLSDGPQITRWVSLQASDRVICFISQAGHTFGVAERGGFRKYLRPSATEDKIGAALTEAFRHCRYVPADARDLSFLKPENAEKAFVEWLNEMAWRFGYFTHKAALENMEYCRVEETNGVISFHPYRHQGGDRWEQLIGAQFTVAADAGAAVVGAAVRRALKLCMDAA